MPTAAIANYEIDTQTAAPGVRRRARLFFPLVAGVLLIALLVGFAKSFFLRSLFEVPPIPFYLYVHGVVLTAWYGLVVAQTWLVAAHRTDLHRHVGVAAVTVAFLVVPISAFVLVQYIPRALARGRELDFIRSLVLGDSLGLLLFAIAVAAGFHFRRRADVHKRLMIASCFAIYGPVFARFDLVYGVPVPVPVATFLPVFVLGVYDLIVARRPHRATVSIALLWIVVWIPLYLLLMRAGSPDAFIEAMR
jgi:hypothetical protein